MQERAVISEGKKCATRGAGTQRMGKKLTVLNVRACISDK